MDKKSNQPTDIYDPFSALEDNGSEKMDKQKDGNTSTNFSGIGKTSMGSPAMLGSSESNKPSFSLPMPSNMPTMPPPMPANMPTIPSPVAATNTVFQNPYPTIPNMQFQQVPNQNPYFNPGFNQPSVQDNSYPANQQVNYNFYGQNNSYPATSFPQQYGQVMLPNQYPTQPGNIMNNFQAMMPNNFLSVVPATNNVGMVNTRYLACTLQNVNPYDPKRKRLFISPRHIVSLLKPVMGVISTIQVNKARNTLRILFRDFQSANQAMQMMNNKKNRNGTSLSFAFLADNAGDGVDSAIFKTKSGLNFITFEKRDEGDEPSDDEFPTNLRQSPDNEKVADDQNQQGIHHHVANNQTRNPNDLPLQVDAELRLKQEDETLNSLEETLNRIDSRLNSVGVKTRFLNCTMLSSTMEVVRFIDARFIDTMLKPFEDEITLMHVDYFRKVLTLRFCDNESAEKSMDKLDRKIVDEQNDTTLFVELLNEDDYKLKGDDMINFYCMKGFPNIYFQIKKESSNEKSESIVKTSTVVKNPSENVLITGATTFASVDVDEQSLDLVEKGAYNASLNLPDQQDQEIRSRTVTHVPIVPPPKVWENLSNSKLIGAFFDINLHRPRPPKSKKSKKNKSSEMNGVMDHIPDSTKKSDNSKPVKSVDDTVKKMAAMIRQRSLSSPRIKEEIIEPEDNVQVESIMQPTKENILSHNKNKTIGGADALVECIVQAPVENIPSYDENITIGMEFLEKVTMIRCRACNELMENTEFDYHWKSLQHYSKVVEQIKLKNASVQSQIASEETTHSPSQYSVSNIKEERIEIDFYEDDVSSWDESYIQNSITEMGSSQDQDAVEHEVINLADDGLELLMEADEDSDVKSIEGDDNVSNLVGNVTDRTDVNSMVCESVNESTVCDRLNASSMHIGVAESTDRFDEVRNLFQSIASENSNEDVMKSIDDFDVPNAIENNKLSNDDNPNNSLEVSKCFEDANQRKSLANIELSTNLIENINVVKPIDNVEVVKPIEKNNVIESIKTNVIKSTEYNRNCVEKVSEANSQKSIEITKPFETRKAASTIEGFRASKSIELLKIIRRKSIEGLSKEIKQEVVEEVEMVRETKDSNEGSVDDDSEELDLDFDIPDSDEESDVEMIKEKSADLNSLNASSIGSNSPFCGFDRIQSKMNEVNEDESKINEEGSDAKLSMTSAVNDHKNNKKMESEGKHAQDEAPIDGSKINDMNKEGSDNNSENKDDDIEGDGESKGQSDLAEFQNNENEKIVDENVEDDVEIDSDDRINPMDLKDYENIEKLDNGAEEIKSNEMNKRKLLADSSMLRKVVQRKSKKSVSADDNDSTVDSEHIDNIHQDNSSDHDKEIPATARTSRNKRKMEESPALLKGSAKKGKTGASTPKVAASRPKTAGSTPKASASTPKAATSNLKASASISKASASTPKAPASTPKANARTSKASTVTTPKATPKTNTKTQAKNIKASLGKNKITPVSTSKKVAVSDKKKKVLAKPTKSTPKSKTATPKAPVSISSSKAKRKR